MVKMLFFFKTHENYTVRFISADVLLCERFNRPQLTISEVNGSVIEIA